MSLMFLSVERIIAFREPFASRSIVTVKRTIIAIVLIWIFSMSCGTLVYFKQVETQFAMTLVFEVCVVIFLVSQAYIIMKMQKRKRKNLFCDHDVSIVTRKHMEKQQNYNQNVTKAVSILIIVVVVTLLPYMVALQIYFLSELHFRPPLDPKTQRFLTEFIYYFYPIELINFIVNPIIYAYRLKRYRNAFLNAFSFLNCGPFVKKRTRSWSEISGNSKREYQNSQKVTKLIAGEDETMT